ncbi:MAG TPA: FAD/NAD(P)-binding protein [Gemmatimonadaceae bacterium]|nr:FAD/NAD(P)-binding protein [Gemmatimonadaceae bacterium]
MPASLLAPEARLAPSWGTNPHQPHLARIVRIERILDDTHLFTIRFLDQAMAEGFRHRPGQFVMVSVLGAGEVPISISSSPSRTGVLELCIRRVGRVTNALFRLRTNELVAVRGPYGNGFPIDTMAGNSVLIVAGGLGMAPLRSLLWYTLDHRDHFDKLTLMYGAKVPSGMLFRDELVSLLDRNDLECLLTVDQLDGSEWRGHVGRLPGLFDHVEIDPATTYAAVCGPPMVYRYVLERLLRLGFSKDRILMSLERKMMCGIGKCGHCSVGWKYTCTHGPIFTYWDAINLPEMI